MFVLFDANTMTMHYVGPITAPEKILATWFTLAFLLNVFMTGDGGEGFQLLIWRTMHSGERELVTTANRVMVLGGPRIAR